MLNQFISSYVSILLNGNSFVKKGLCWNRKRSLFVDVINFQKANYSTIQKIHFTINFGIAVPDFVSIIFPDKNKTTFFDPSLTVLPMRPGNIINGFFIKKPTDVWYTLTKYNMDTISQEVIKKISLDILPFIDNIDSLEMLYELQSSALESNSKYWFTEANIFINMLYLKKIGLSTINKFSSSVLNKDLIKEYALRFNKEA